MWVKTTLIAATVAALVLGACTPAGEPPVETFGLAATVEVDLAEVFAAIHDDDATGVRDVDEADQVRVTPQVWATAATAEMLALWCDQLGGALAVQAVGARVQARCTATPAVTAQGRLRALQMNVAGPDLGRLVGLPPFDLGDDPVLDALVAACGQADGASCDELFELAPQGSAYRQRSGGVEEPASDDSGAPRPVRDHPRVLAQRAPVSLEVVVVAEGRLVDVSDGARVSDDGVVRVSWDIDTRAASVPVAVSVRTASWWNGLRVLLAGVAAASATALVVLHDLPRRRRAPRAVLPQQPGTPQNVDQAALRPPSFADPDSYTSFPPEWSDDTADDADTIDPVGEWPGPVAPQPFAAPPRAPALPPLAPPFPQQPPVALPAVPPPPGWYPDPLDVTRVRWWDGSAWGPAQPR
jgi:hypothetical protein